MNDHTDEIMPVDLFVLVTLLGTLPDKVMSSQQADLVEAIKDVLADADTPKERARLMLDPEFWKEAGPEVLNALKPKYRWSGGKNPASELHMPLMQLLRSDFPSLMLAWLDEESSRQYQKEYEAFGRMWCAPPIEYARRTATQITSHPSPPKGWRSRRSPGGT